MQVRIEVNGANKKEGYKAAELMLRAAGMKYILAAEDGDSLLCSQDMTDADAFARDLMHLVWAACSGDRDSVVDLLADMLRKAMTLPEPKGEKTDE